MASPLGSTASLSGPVIRARARLRYSTITPMKARRVVDMIRGLPADEALALLRFAPQAASATVYKLLESAIANAQQEAAKQGERLDVEDLVVSTAYVDEGPTLKRFRPRAQGRAYRIRKRTSHITIHVESWPAEAESRAARRAIPKGSRHRRPMIRTIGATRTTAGAVTEPAAAAPSEPEQAAAEAAPLTETSVAESAETPASQAAEESAGASQVSEKPKKTPSRRPAARKPKDEGAGSSEGDGSSNDEGGTR